MLLPVALRPFAPGAARLRDCLVAYIITFAFRLELRAGAFAVKTAKMGVS